MDFKLAYVQKIDFLTLKFLAFFTVNLGNPKYHPHLSSASSPIHPKTTAHRPLPAPPKTL